MTEPTNGEMTAKAWTPAVPGEPIPGQMGDGPDELASQNRPGEIVPQGAYFEMLGLLRTLKARREAKGLTVADVSERSGMTRRAIDKLESGRLANPRIGTLYRYALSLDAGFTFGIEEVEAAQEKPSA